MPRVHRAQPGTSTSKLKQCLQALVTDPEAACMGGNELCCAGCGGNSDLVDSLCAFCLHSDAARRYFASNGGLDALLLAGRNSQSEKTILASLQVLQCLCSTQLGQLLVATQKPELLQMVCDQALDQDEEREGVQHAALTILTGWASGDSDSELLSWFTHCPAIKQQQAPHQLQRPPPGHSLVFGSGTLLPFPSVLDSTTPSQQPTFTGAPTTTTTTTNSITTLATTTTNCMSISEPAMLHIASRALQHPTLAVRRAAAQLFAAAAAHGADASTATAAVTRVDSLAQQVQQLLRAEQQSAGMPRFAAYANGRSQLILDPMAFIRHQQHVQEQKQACHALLHMACELAVAGPACLAVLGRAGSCLPALLAVFESAWQVGAARVPVPSRGGVLPDDVPFSFLQDHQSRELALDALVVVLKQPGMLANLGRSLAAADSDAAPASQHQQQSGAGAGNSSGTAAVVPTPAATHDDPSQQQAVAAGSEQQQAGGGELAAEQAALERLLRLVHSLLLQQSAGHVRAALTLVGHVRFEHLPPQPDAAAAGSGTEEGGGDGGAHGRWLQQLCDLFDATWQAEQSQSPRAGAQGTPVAAAEPRPVVVADGVGWPGPVGAAQGPGFQQATEARPAAGGVGDQADAAGEQRAVFTLDVGLGYRVLVQVLQSWKSLLDVGTAAILSQLQLSGYTQRVTLALSHHKPMVAAAAHKVLYYGSAPPALLGGPTLHQQVGLSDATTWGDWGTWNGMEGGLQDPNAGGGALLLDAGPLDPDLAALGALNQEDDSFLAAAAAAMGFDMGRGVAAGPGGVPGGTPEEDAEMQEFLSVFLGSAAANLDGPSFEPLPTPQDQEPTPATTSMVALPSRSQAAAPADLRSGMFSAWDGGGDQGDEEALADALTLLPSLDEVAQNMCIKYDNSPGPMMGRRPGAAMASPLAMLNL